MIEKNAWLPQWGPRPGQPGCKVPPRIARRAGDYALIKENESMKLAGRMRRLVAPLGHDLQDTRANLDAYLCFLIGGAE